MSSQPIPIEQRERDYEVAEAGLAQAAEVWLEQRAKHGGRMPRRYDIQLDLAHQECRRAQRRLDTARHQERRRGG